MISRNQNTGRFIGSNKVLVQCFGCPIKFSVYGYRKNTAKYHSRKCKDNHQKITMLGENNPYKGKSLTEEHKRKISKNNGKYWLGKKRIEMRGKNHPRYTGNYSFGYMERRRFASTIRKQVLKRDDYTCQLCGQRGGELQVDHIQAWADYVELRFNIENCRTLCQKCHYQITYGKPMSPIIRTWGHNIFKGGIQK